jgi:hypothetical protein
MTFALDPETSEVASFTVGERVSVRYRTSSSGTVHQVASIAVEPPAEVDEETSLDRLPATASSLPLIGLLGLLSLGGAAALRLGRS